jgi:Uma2 family endonuclease
MGTAAQPIRRLFTVPEYHRLGEAGILTEHDRAELIEGEIIQMTPIGSEHAACVDRLNRLLQRPDSPLIVRVQNPIWLSDHSEPQPDICLLRSREDYYAAGHPGPRDVLLVVEVADTSLEYDRTTKLSLYATAGIPEVWVVDVNSARVEVFTDPKHGLYARSARYVREETIVSGVLPGTQLPVAAILG